LSDTILSCVTQFLPFRGNYWENLPNQQFEELLFIRQQIDQYQTHFDLLKHQLQAKMKDAERACFKAGSVTWKKSKDSVQFDSKSALKAQPELLAKYPLNKTGSRRFNIYGDKPEFN
jgi:predicted phage-related endonuclease